MKTNTEHLKEKILDISQRQGLTHIGSCISILPILEDIYAQKHPNDKVILDGAHSHLAHLMFTDANNAEELIKRDIHCNRLSGCDISGGSLGHGLGIALGLALANRERQVFCVVTDGSLGEGSNWEALRIKKDLKLDNLIVYANLNGSTALEEIDRDNLKKRLDVFCSDIQVRYTNNGEGFEGVKGHYQKLS